MRKMLAGALAAAMTMTVLASGEAFAAEVGDEPAQASDTRWYGWQTLAVDTAAASTMIVGVATAPKGAESAASLLLPTRLMNEPPESTPLVDAGLALYTVGPAVVHAVHGRPLASVGSAAIRAAGPTAGLVVGFGYGVLLAIPVAIVAPGQRRSEILNFGSNGEAVIVAGMASGVALGTIGPIVIDAVALAHEPAEKPAETKKDPAAVTVEPRLGYTKNGPTVGLSGTF